MIDFHCSTLERILQFDGVETAGQPRQMFVRRERLAAVRAHDLVHAVGELKAAVLHANGGAFERQKLSVDVCDLGHWSVIPLVEKNNAPTIGLRPPSVNGMRQFAAVKCLVLAIFALNSPRDFSTVRVGEP